MPNPTSTTGPVKRGTSNGFMGGGKQAPKLAKSRMGVSKALKSGSNAALQANWKV